MKQYFLNCLWVVNKPNLLCKNVTNLVISVFLTYYYKFTTILAEDLSFVINSVWTVFLQIHLQLYIILL